MLLKLDIVDDGEEIVEIMKDNMSEYKKKEVYVFNGKSFEMTRARASLNALIFQVLPESFQSEDYLFMEEGSSKNLHNYEQLIADQLFDDGYNVDEVKEIIYDLKEQIITHVNMFNMHVNIDISMYDFIKMIRDDDRIKKIMCNDIFNQDMGAHQIQELKKQLCDEIEEYVLENEVDPFYTMLSAGAGMRRAQFYDITVGVGIRPYREQVYPYTIPESWLNGLKTKESFWVENDSARNALILQKLHITDTGTFNKRATMLAQPNYLHEDPSYMCDTINFVEEEVTKDNFYRFVGSYHMVGDEPKMITPHDTDLIGKVINYRQPLTCTCDDGICRYCVGDKLYFDNIEGFMGGQRNLGAVITKQKIAPRVQGYLSAKHNNSANLSPLKVHSKVDWTKIFDIAEVDKFRFREEVQWVEFEEPEKTGYIFPRYDRIFKSSKIHVKIKGEKTITFDTESYFYVDSENFDEESNRVIDINDIHLRVVNNPVSSGYHKINKIFNKSENAKVAVDDLKELMSEEKMVVPYLLVRNLVRDAKNLEERPDFANTVNPALTIVPMSTAIRNMKELGLKLSIGWFGDALADVRNYKDEKTKPTKFNILFRSRKTD